MGKYIIGYAGDAAYTRIQLEDQMKKALIADGYHIKKIRLRKRDDKYQGIATVTRESHELEQKILIHVDDAGKINIESKSQKN